MSPAYSRLLLAARAVRDSIPAPLICDVRTFDELGAAIRSVEKAIEEEKRELEQAKENFKRLQTMPDWDEP